MNNFSFKKLQNQIQNLDNKTIKLININNIISIIFCILGIFLMLFHYKFYISKFLFLGSITLFRTGLLIGICSYIFGITINKYKENHTKNLK